VAEQLDASMPGGTLGYPSLAFNALLDRSPPSDAAVAVQAPEAGAPVHLLRPCGDRLLVGTGHATWSQDPATPKVSDQAVEQMLAAVNRALPGLDLQPNEVRRTMAGLLPARRPGRAELVTRERVYAHNRHGGPARLISIGSIKYTTAPYAAEQALRRAFGPRRGLSFSPRPAVTPMPTSLTDPDAPSQASAEALRQTVQHLIEHEAAHDLADIVHRRTDWGLYPGNAQTLQARLASEQSGVGTGPGDG
jgi:glycerol-3-phosphate dehydrogenase